MPVEEWSDNVVVARLADHAQLSDDLDALDRMTQQRRRHAVVDFANIGMVNSSHLAKLLKVRRQMNTAGLKLVLCGMNDHVWGAFLVTNLDKLFEFSD